MSYFTWTIFFWWSTLLSILSSIVLWGKNLGNKCLYYWKVSEDQTDTETLQDHHPPHHITSQPEKETNLCHDLGCVFYTTFLQIPAVFNAIQFVWNFIFKRSNLDSESNIYLLLVMFYTQHKMPNKYGIWHFITNKFMEYRHL